MRPPVPAIPDFGYYNLQVLKSLLQKDMEFANVLPIYLMSYSTIFK